jgi:hypothetical protein
MATLVESRSEAGRAADVPLRRAVVAAVVSNPYAGRYVEDLSEAIEWSATLGAELAALAVETLGAPVESYGKGGLVGMDGEQEHAAMLLTTTFATPVRNAVGGAVAWMSSATRVGPAGTALTIPLAHKDALYVRSHYDAITLYPDAAPRPDEIVIALAVANRSRLNHRVGGLAAADIEGTDGLR